MSQQPKLYDDSQERERTETPDEVAAGTRAWFPTAESLAQQLGSDAVRLASRYPAPDHEALLARMLREQALRHPPLAAEPLSPAASETPELTLASDSESRSSKRSRAWNIPQFAAAALVLIAGWSVLRWSADKPLAVAPAHDLSRVAQPRDPVMIPVALPVSPLEPQEFQTLSAPEREAVLDLLEEQALGTVSLSI